MGMYANEGDRCLNVIIEAFDVDSENQIYQEKNLNMYGEYIKDPTDYFLTHNIQPKVYKYQVGVYPVLNGKFIDYSPILFEKGDTLDVIVD